MGPPAALPGRTDHPGAGGWMRLVENTRAIATVNDNLDVPHYIFIIFDERKSDSRAKP